MGPKLLLPGRLVRVPATNTYNAEQDAAAGQRMMRQMPYQLGLLAICLLLSGCKQPMQVVTRSAVVLGSPPLKNIKPLLEMPVQRGGDRSAKIALIDVDGLLLNRNMMGIFSAGENPVAIFREKLDRVAADGCYRGVVLRIHSLGGGVTASDIMRRDLEAFQAKTHLPVVACIMDVGAGGAYYLATACDRIWAHPTSMVGGMGVMLNLYNLQDTMAQFNVVGVTVKSGQHADLGTPIGATTEESRKLLQQISDQLHRRFRDVVATSRPGIDVSNASLFDGRIFTGPQAQELKLIDDVGYLDDALDSVRHLAGCPQAAVMVLHRYQDMAHTVYDVTPNTPVQSQLLPTLPGLNRSQLPTFLYMWQPEPTALP